MFKLENPTYSKIAIIIKLFRLSLPEAQGNEEIGDYFKVVELGNVKGMIEVNTDLLREHFGL